MKSTKLVYDPHWYCGVASVNWLTVLFLKAWLCMTAVMDTIGVATGGNRRYIKYHFGLIVVVYCSNSTKCNCCILISSKEKVMKADITFTS